MRRLLTAILVSVIASTANAWSDAGHKTIASIAFRQLTPEQQQKVADILRKHPRFDQDFKAKMPEGLSDEEQNEFIFQQAAIWPDMARGFRGEDAKYNHPTWHYLDIPSYLTPEDQAAMAATVKLNVSLDPPEKEQQDMNAVQAIRLARKMIADSSVPDETKAVMLCWLFHVTGDIHQPLHSSSLFSQKLFPTGDRGGNSIKTEQHGNLHSLWDGFLGGRAEYREARNKAVKLLADPEKEKFGTEAAKKLDEKDWLDESHKYCEEFAYDAEVSGYLRSHITESQAPPIQLTERYLKAGGGVSEQRVTEAGYRLGAVLVEITKQ
jgi:hypothetical protein